MRACRNWLLAWLALCLIGTSPSSANDAQQLINGLIQGLQILDAPRAQPVRRPSRQSERPAPDTSLLEAQRNLLALGYAVEADGRFGEVTRRAVRAYQRDHGFPTTGKLTRVQLDHLQQLNNNRPGRAVAVTDDDVPLSSRDMADLQRRLSMLGYDVGRPDGKGGPKTGRALSNFLASRGHDPYQTSPQAAYEMVLAASTPAGAGTALSTPGEASFGVGMHEQSASSGYMDWPTGSILFDEDRTALNEAITRRIIHTQPDLLEQPATLARLLEDMGRGYRGVWSPDEIAPLYASYKDGSEFDRLEALGAFKAFLAQQGSAEPMTITRVRPVTLGSFDFEKKAFPLGLDDDFGTQMRFYGPAGLSLVAEAEDLRLPHELALPPEQAEPIASRLRTAGSRLIDMAAILEINGYSVGNDQFGRQTIFAKMAVRSVTLHLKPAQGGRGLGETLTTLQIEAPEAVAVEAPLPPANSNIGSWTRLGFAEQDGRVVIPVARAGATDREQPGMKAFQLLALAHLPAQPRSVGTAFRYSQAFASKEKFASLFPLGRNETEFLRALERDPFRQEELVNRFNAEVLPQLKSEAPRLPARLRASMPVDLGSYDLAKEAFGVGPDRLILPGVAFRSNMKPNFPRQLKVPRAQARSLIEEAKKNSGRTTLYYGIDIDLETIEVQMREDERGAFRSADTHTTLTGKIKAVSLFRDAELTKRITVLPLYDFVPEPEVLPGSEAPSGHYLTRWNLAALASELTGDPDLGSALVEASSFVAEKDEFGRAAAIERGMNLHRNAKIDQTGPLYLIGEMTLGAFDGVGQFQIEKTNFSVSLDQDPEQLDAGLMALSVENSEAVSALIIGREEAEQLVRNRPGRTFPALFKVRPVRAEKNATGTKPLVRLDVAIQQVMLMDTKHRERVIYSTMIRPTAEFGEEVVLEQQPDRLPLNTETTALILAKYTGEAPDETMLRSLLLKRWEEESHIRKDVINADPAPWGRFFPRNYRQLTQADVERLLPRFRKWTELRIASLPSKLLYENYDDLSGSQKYFGWPAKEHVETLREIGIDRRAHDFYRGHLFNEQTVIEGQYVTPKTILSLVQELSPRGRVDVYVPLENIPSPPPDAYARAVSLEMEVRRGIKGANPQDNKPIIVLDVVPTQVRWFGDQSSGKPRNLLATFSLPPLPPRTPFEAKALDILGLSIGMPRDEAEKRIRAELKVERVLELSGDPSNPAAITESARLYVGAGGTDLVGVLFGPTVLEPKVYGVARSFYAPHGSLNPAGVLGALTAKYGDVSVPNKWLWGESTDIGLCGQPGTPYTINWAGARVIEGPPLLAAQVSQQQLESDPAIAAEVRLIRRLQGFHWGFDVQAPQENCTPSVAARFQESLRLGFAGERIPEGETSVLWSWMFDHTARYRSLAEAQQKPKIAPLAADIKL